MGRAFEYRKARKMKRWGFMAKTFTRIGKDIAIAVKAGGPDPDTNSRLRAIIQNAKTVNMPKDNVERAIKRASSKEQEDYKEMVYEGYAPHGIAVVIECTTDNPTRTVANIRSYFNRAGGSLGTSGSLDFLFERKCSFKIAKSKFDVEELELELIDYGADEVFIDEEEIVIYGGFQDFGAIQKALEEKGCEIRQAEFERVPLDTKELSPEAEEEVQKLIEKFEEDDDVQYVFHNMR
ncbi:MAG: YebC/PmpR family DNA-binding transcriptional regulator [Microscillaceae bacterium]|jgi:YebC/PmpR family DNA-binding regulatory protein|nr:YebC/PmpR family DNA-binding transcriptional regulator [Microscillaceae bacterium]